MGGFSRWPVAAALAAALLAPVAGRAAVPTAPDLAQASMDRARSLAIAGQRGEAIQLLRHRLALAPDDSDARVLLGTVLSWDRSYDDARLELQAVLQKNATNLDALRALINVESWSSHPDRVEQLTREALQREPDSIDLLVARTRALIALRSLTEARTTVGHLLDLDPRSRVALALSDEVDGALRTWEGGVVYGYDRFTQQGRQSWDWHEVVAQLKHRHPRMAVTGRVYVARRWGKQDSQLEVEGYPRLWQGAYADLAVAVRPLEGSSYPRYRLAGDLYQGIGMGLEAQAGLRRLQFDGATNLFVGSLSKYLGSWLLTSRSFVSLHDHPSWSVHGIVRRYFGDRTSYLTLRYGYGREGVLRDTRSVNDIAYQPAHVVFAEVNHDLGRFAVNFNIAVLRQSNLDGTTLMQYSPNLALTYVF